MPDYCMKFFSPELYMRINSRADDVADRAAREWEQAIENYRGHLQGLPLTEHVKQLSRVCFHEALLLDKTTHPGRVLPTKYRPATSGSPWIASDCTTVLLATSDRLIQLFYFAVGSDPLSVDHSPEWNLWEETARWLYDEVDVAEDEPKPFVHRILWSDGSVFTIPFWDVSIVTIHLDQRAELGDSGRRDSVFALPG